MRLKVYSMVSSIALMAGTSIHAQEIPPTYSIFGTPGLLEMPSAQTPQEGTLATTVSYRDGLFQTVLSFQLTDRISGSFRYALVDLYDETASGVNSGEFERGVDLQFQLLEETEYLPSVALGLRDFLTPGRFQSEYVVATKSLGDSLTVTAGLGWGAMGTRNGFDNPFSSRAVRPVFDEAEPEGQLATDYWFAGDASVFGGLEYQINDRWGVLAEYSSLAYPEQPNAPAIGQDSPYSIGVTYRPREGMQFSAAALNGEELAVSGTFFLNANNRPGMSGIETAPLPVKVRTQPGRVSTLDQSVESNLRRGLAQTLREEDMSLVAMEIDGDVARIRFTNRQYRSNAQAMGRIARIMTHVMPEGIEVFVFEQVDKGIPLSSVRIRRADLENLENRPGAASSLFESTEFIDAGAEDGLVRVNEFAPSFSWDYSPYFRLDPFASSGGSVSVDAGVSLNASYRISPRTVLASTLQQSLFRNDAEDPGIDGTPDLQNVRSDGGFYGDDGVPVLQSLALTHYGRPGTDLYSRVSVGYLERMFGGVSGELLWKPVDSSLGIGAELSYVSQRDTDMWFGFDEYDYQVATGHLSAYYDFGNGYHTQVDIGRYLAGDWGATVEVAREYDNGIRLAASVSQTEVSYEDYGNGSYNKRLSITLPRDFFTGRPSRGNFSTQLSLGGGDGGARLNVGGRLYDVVRGAHQADLSDTWGRFWR